MNSDKHPKILAVDDEELNLDIIKENLSDANYEVILASSGQEALDRVKEHADIDVIVLDRMMPDMNGIEVVKTLKSTDGYKHIPIVMQTAAAQTSQVIEGIHSGIYYYLTKPYSGKLLVSIVKAALDESNRRREIKEELIKNTKIPQMMESGEFEFRTLEEAKSIAFFISHAFPDPVMAAFGLTELMINAIEHGNLGITYGDKTRLLLEGQLFDRIEELLEHEDYKHKKVILRYVNDGQQIKVHIQDEGNGFDWQKYLDFSPERLTDPHGRGIATSRSCFSSIEYLGKGNEVICTMELK